MWNILIAAIHRLFAATLFAAILLVQPVSAQLSGDTAEYVTASYARPFARYYAPYALQAAAAYIPVASFDATRGPSRQPSLDGSDVRLAVADYSEPEIAKAATKYLQSWQYQFGSEGYLTCFEADPDCLKALGRDRFTLAISGGPTFHVWARTRAARKAGSACSEVSIAFRGSTISTADWITNLDPVTGYVFDDHYRQMRRNIDAIIKKITTLDCYRRAKTQIVSVGHSLGAGLAQFSAIANNPAGPRITKVFAFDSSPVTGASYIDKRVRAQNANAEVDFVYQSGEALQRLRPTRPSAPCARTVVFDALLPASSVTLHNMPALAREIVRMSYEDGVQKRYVAQRKLIQCPSQYLTPATDEDADSNLVATRAGAARFAGANPISAANVYAFANGFDSREEISREMNRTVARPLRTKTLKNAKRPAALTGDEGATVAPVPAG